MTDAEPLFIDTNVLVYANVAESPFHQQALSTIEAAYQAGRALWISRQILREYLVIMSRPQAFETLPIATVKEQAEQFTQRFVVADETSSTTQQLLVLLNRYTIGGKQIHDANIVATMQSYNISSVLTANVKDFKRFEDIITIESLT
ncbi:MAG: type II toxin-antitoxin system VapC family toxin [Pseudomonadales bacterium]